MPRCFQSHNDNGWVIVTIMKTLCILLATLGPVFGEVLQSIPVNLLPCYRGGGPRIGAPKRLDVFLSLVRRLELDSRLDLRLFSTSLLRSLRLDGIENAANTPETEFLIPYRASAFQFHKFKMLMDLFLPSQDLIDVDEVLTLDEKCLLHFTLSCSIHPWERGDENIVCPLSAERRQSLNTQSQTRLYSRCPIEVGVIQTSWGSITPGTLVAAIAASLETQRVLVTDILQTKLFKEEVPDTLLDMAVEEWNSKLERLELHNRGLDVSDINNVWVATLAGDLAEVVVNQGARFGASPQRMVIGSSNKWNDTLLPRDYYLFMQNASSTDWHMTDAEILAGIDGLILSHFLPTWIEQRRTLRLSQIIEMYYSNDGVSFDPKVRACNRQALFTSIVNKDQLLSETSRLAHILSLRQITVYIPVDEMNRISEAAVTVFMDYVSSLLRQNHIDCVASRSVPTMDLVLATDGTWNGYEVEQFVSWIGGALDINMQKSSIALLHGNTGRWIVPRTQNLTSLFTTIANYSEWPNRLNLPNVVSAVLQDVRNTTIKDISDMRSAGPSTVVLIIAPTSRMSSEELERTRDIMSSLRESFFDVYFAYAARDTSEFKNINNEFMDYSELFLTVSSTSVSDVISAVNTYLVKNVIPSRIISSQCPFNGTHYVQVPYEDNVLPAREQPYRIHPFYLRQQKLIQVQFRNDGQGRILICMWRGTEASHACQSLNERESYIFNMTKPCPSPNFCPPANFMVTALSTQNLCAHVDCRLPHQVGYYIQHSGLRCLPLLGIAASVQSAPIWKVIWLSLVISLVY